MAVQPAAYVWRNYNVDGVSASGLHKPDQAEIRAWGTMIEGVANSSTIVKPTLAALQAATPAAETNGGMVLDDPDPTKNGTYYRSAGAWVKGRGFPDSFTVFEQTGGTANALQLTSEAGVNPGNVVAGLLVPDASNTGATTIAINGATAVPLLSAAGSPLAAGELVAGKATIIAKIGDDWRVILAFSQFSFRKAWDSATTYVADDIVESGGSLWLALRGNTNVTPVEGADWTLFLPGVTVADGSITAEKLTTDETGLAAIVTKLSGFVGGLGALAKKSIVALADIADDAKADFRLVDPNGPRIPVEYHSAYKVQIVGVRSIAMGGFRYRGRYKVGRAPVFDMPAFTDAERHVIDLGNGTSTAGNLFAESYHSKETWYAQFAAANDGDPTATLGSMPFLRVGSIAGNVVTLNLTGENDRTVSGKTHQFTTDGLVGCDVLVISETLDSRANAFSGRMTTVTANTQTTVTLADVGTMDEFDFFLVAPPGFEHYCYLNTCFIDSAELRNIADDGYRVGTRGGDNTQANINGVLSAIVRIPCDGHISPLASGVEFDHREVVGTADVGTGTVRYGLDESNHDYFSMNWRKTATGSEAWTIHVNAIPFAGYKGQSVYLFPAGALNIAGVTRQMQPRGWTEL